MRAYLLPAILGLGFFILSVLILSEFGINWDAPQRMLRGQAYLDLFLHTENSPKILRLSPILINPDEYVTHYSFSASEGTKMFAKLPARPLPKLEYENEQKLAGKKLSFYQHPAWNADLYSQEVGGHPPLIDMLAALSNRLFFGVLGMFGDIESYQLVYVLIGAIGVFIVSAFALDISGSWMAGLVAGLSLAFFPIFFSEIHFNMKDPLQACFFAGAIWTFWKWIKLGRLRWFGLFGVFLVAALGVKWNIIFLPAILLPWLFLIRKSGEFKAWFKLRLGVLGVLGMLGVLLISTLIWPQAWSNPIGFFFKILDFYKWIGIGNDHAQPPGFIFAGFNFYPLILLFSQTPEIILALVIFGVVGVFRGKKDSLKSGYLLLLWLLVPLIRYSIPGVRSYNGIRQIMEVIPAMAVLAGIGANYLITKFSKIQVFQTNSNIKFLKIVCILVIGYLLLLPLRQFHPNENVYFNNLVGGLKGAKDHGLIDWSLTYGNVYKQGLNWFNQYAEKDANLAIIDGRMFAASFLWLRNDISISPNHFSGLDHKGEYIMGVFDPYNQPVFAARFPGKFLEPVHIITEDGVPLLYIYKNDLSHVKTGFQKESSTDQFKVKSAHLPIGDYIEIDLGKEVKVTRIILENVSDKCNVENYVFVDEFVAFVGKNSKQDLSPSDYLFAINERKRLENGDLEFSFPAEEAYLIRVYPKSEYSCFVGSKISKISYLSD